MNLTRCNFCKKEQEQDLARYDWIHVKLMIDYQSTAIYLDSCSECLKAKFPNIKPSDFKQPPQGDEPIRDALIELINEVMEDRNA